MALKKLLWRKYLFVNRVEAETEQTYWNEKRKKHLAHEHSEGVVRDLGVTETNPPSLTVQVAAGRALDTEGNDPEAESPQDLDCAALVPASGEVTVYITLRYNTLETEPYFVDELGASQNKYVQDSFVLEATTQVPSAPAVELARFRLGAGATAIRNAADPNNPGLNEIDLRQVKYSGKEVTALRDLSDVDPAEADAFNGMENPSASNPIATVSKADSIVAPVRSEVVTARGTKPSLDERLDVMLNDDGSFKGITKITPAAPLTGGGTAGDIPLGINDATPAARGAMSAADKAKLDGIEAGATADQTAQEILDALKTVDGAGSGLDADLLDGSPHRGLGGAEHAAATPTEAGFMSVADKVKLDTLSFLDGVRGCRLAWIDEQTIRVEPGQISVDAEVRANTAGLNINLTFNLESGQTATDNTWYYVYVKPEPDPATNFTAFLSKTIPTKIGRHPTLAALFVGSVRRQVGKFRCFTRSKNLTVWRDAAGSGAFSGLENQNDIVNGGVGGGLTVSVANFMPPTASAILVMYDVESHIRVRPAAHVALGASGMGFEGFGAVQEGPYILIPDNSFQLHFQQLGGGSVDAHRVGSYGYFEDIESPSGPFGS
ncbi:MAG: hypothetical protein RB146_08795 [Armatimonadota bacterium]|nr:hypothetical protein [Armatimonadota bacterium]